MSGLLPPEPAPAPLATAPAGHCRNCQAPLFGPYCARCGQEARGSARSLLTLLFDARDALIHLDSRLWRTLHALALRPGVLTAEYFAERRARYLPPFRLYLVLSLAFFSLATFERLKLQDPEALPLELREGARQEVKEELGAAAREMRADPAAPPRAGAALERAVKELEKREGKAVSQGQAPEPDPPPEKLCQDIIVSGSPRLQAALIDACRRNLEDRGRTLWRSVAANIPRMMFVFLPLMALFLKALYWRPRRYYVEHLVFFLHTHAAVFLVSIAALGLRSLAGALGADGLAGLVGLAAWCYGTWYVFRAMRAYYGQGRLLTSAKFFALGMAYVFFLSLTLLGTVAIAATVAT